MSSFATAACTQDQTKVEAEPQVPHYRAVNSAAYSPDGAYILSCGWDAATGAPLRTFGGIRCGWVLSVAFSPDGARVLSGGAYKAARLWDVATGALLRTFGGHLTS